MTITIGTGGTGTTVVTDIVMIPTIGGMVAGVIVTTHGMSGIADTIMTAITTMINVSLGNGTKFLAFRRSLQADHPLLPQLKLEVYGDKRTGTGELEFSGGAK